jgi:hypothetical protein
MPIDPDDLPGYVVAYYGKYMRPEEFREHQELMLEGKRLMIATRLRERQRPSSVENATRVGDKSSHRMLARHEVAISTVILN